MISRRDFLRLLGGLAAAGAFPGLARAAAAGALPHTRQGDIPEEERITLERALTRPGVDYFVHYLPPECAQIGGSLYQVRPQAVWWHWDGGQTPATGSRSRVEIIWNTLVSRTRRNDPIAVHFGVGPDIVLQMLPLSATMAVQGRVTDDRKIAQVTEAASLGAIQIETTGKHYDSVPPAEAQTATLVDLTIAAMRQYRIPFPAILGHRERSARIPKPDPGLRYLKETRVRLLKDLIARGHWHLIGPPGCWEFYREALRGGEIVRLPTQSSGEILAQLTERERALVRIHTAPPGRRSPLHFRAYPL